MSTTTKNQRKILGKLGIEQLNSMQEEAQLAIHSCPEVVLLSPTGTGKTLAFLLPIISELDPANPDVQVLILVPSRELALQIEQVIRDMGTGYKTNAVYGGRSFSKDKIDLKHRPAILIGTPGRVAHHLRKRIFNVNELSFLVLDEYDKSLEIGFASEMQEILSALPQVKKKVMTSASEAVGVPEFVGLNNPTVINYLEDGIRQLEIKKIISPSKDKLQTLFDTICHLGNQPGIIFCNFKDSIQRVSNFLTQHDIKHGCFYGGMEQIDRERALIKFRNGTHQLIIATDLAARGLDIPEIRFIIHYHLPQRDKEFIHRNGRTARMHQEGTAYLLQWEQEILPAFIPPVDVEELRKAPLPSPSNWNTIFVSGGRKDKISKGDIAGLFFKQARLDKNELGRIELKQDCAFVAVQKSKVDQVIELLIHAKIKKRKIRTELI